MCKRAATLAAAVLLALSAPVMAQATDAPVHDRYAATVRCWQVAPGLVAGIPVTSVMRDDNDAIDSAVQRYADLGMSCLGPLDAEVVYIP